MPSVLPIMSTIERPNKSKQNLNKSYLVVSLLTITMVTLCSGRALAEQCGPSVLQLPLPMSVIQTVNLFVIF